MLIMYISANVADIIEWHWHGVLLINILLRSQYLWKHQQLLFECLSSAKLSWRNVEVRDGVDDEKL